MDIVKQIVKSNKYEMLILNKIHNKREKQEQGNRKKKWAKFTYMGRETRYIMKLFKNTNVRITYTTNNNLGKLLATRTDQNLDKYDGNGVYQLECPTCNKKYIGHPDDRSEWDFANTATITNKSTTHLSSHSML